MARWLGYGIAVLVAGTLLFWRALPAGNAPPEAKPPPAPPARVIREVVPPPAEEPAPVTIADLNRIEQRLIRLERNARARADDLRAALQVGAETKDRLRTVENQLYYLRASQDLIREGINEIRDALSDHAFRTEPKARGPADPLPPPKTTVPILPAEPLHRSTK